MYCVLKDSLVWGLEIFMIWWIKVDFMIVNLFLWSWRLLRCHATIPQFFHDKKEKNLISLHFGAANFIMIASSRRKSLFPWNNLSNCNLCVLWRAKWIILHRWEPEITMRLRKSYRLDWLLFYASSRRGRHRLQFSQFRRVYKYFFDESSRALNSLLSIFSTLPVRSGFSFRPSPSPVAARLYPFCCCFVSFSP